jgi:malate dehydrogenase
VVRVVEGLEIGDAVRVRMQATEKELREERDAVAHLLG